MDRSGQGVGRGVVEQGFAAIDSLLGEGLSPAL